MSLSAKPARIGPVLWLLCCGLSLGLSQLCETQGWRSFECRELSSLKDLKNVRDFPTDNLHRLSIRNERTELSMGMGKSGLRLQLQLQLSRICFAAASTLSLSGLLDLDLSHVPQLQLERRGFSWLPQLEQLNISGCRLEQLLATHFAANSSLQLLDASHNELSALTKDLFDKLRKLIYANFSDNALQQLELPHMPLLQQLQLSHNQLTNISLGLCPQLQQLSLNDNQLSQVSKQQSMKTPEARHHLLCIYDLNYELS